MRWVKRVLIFIGVLVVGLGVYGFLTVRASYPQLNGELTVPILGDEVEVVRDDFGIPHIYASSTADLFRAQGFVEAQDRFFQMDFWRHIGSGNLSAMFGESQLETDMFLRALDFRGIAEKELDEIPDDTRQILEWYSDGVNAYLSDHDGAALSLEYAILPLQAPGYVPESWSPINTLTWAKVMSWDLSSNFGDEIARAVLRETLDPGQVEQLFPPYPSAHPYVVPSEIRSQASAAAPSVQLPFDAIGPLVAADQARRLLDSATGGGFEGIGSNNWVVSGDLTQSGSPVLANDPHLANQIPSIWYEVGLHCNPVGDRCPFDVVGFGFPGTPGVVIGHNANIAWGVTTEAADTQDLYIEKINPDNHSQYEVDGEWVDMAVRDETIQVADGTPVSYEVYSTKHGPVISGLHGGADDLAGTQDGDYAVALAWQSLEPSTLIQSILLIDLASDWGEFRNAAGFWDIAAQNLVYADTSGNIGYQSTGEIPLRADADGLFPQQGWDSSNDWVGVVPFADMPFVFNPERGFLESANQPVLAPGELPHIGRDSAYGYRAGRIEEMIGRTASHTVKSAQEMQMDARDGGAARIAPALLVVPTRQPQVLEIQNAVEKWSMGIDGFQTDHDSPGAAAYQATWRHLLAGIFHDNLPEDYWPEGGSRWFEVVASLAENPNDPFWDDLSTPATETATEIMEQAMLLAHEELTRTLGADPNEWRWGDLHIANFESQTLGQSGIAPIEWLFNRTAPSRVSGSSSIVNAVGWSPAVGYEVDWVPSMRMVVDLGDFDNSTSIHTTGQSGHAFHGNYADMIDMWTDGEQHPMLWTRATVDGAAANTLLLVP